MENTKPVGSLEWAIERHGHISKACYEQCFDVLEFQGKFSKAEVTKVVNMTVDRLCTVLADLMSFYIEN